MKTFFSQTQINALNCLADGEWYWGITRATGRALVRNGWAEYKRASVHMWRITEAGRQVLAQVKSQVAP